MILYFPQLFVDSIARSYGKSIEEFDVNPLRKLEIGTETIMLTWIYRIIFGTLLLLLLGVVVGFFLIWNQSRRELAQFEAEYQSAKEQLSALRDEREEKEAYLKAFLNNPEFVERVVRERLGYVKPGETLFRFEDPS